MGKSVTTSENPHYRLFGKGWGGQIKRNLALSVYEPGINEKLIGGGGEKGGKKMKEEKEFVRSSLMRGRMMLHRCLPVKHWLLFSHN